MDFVVGRNNLALTVFVPFDCQNNCSFCSSKESYLIEKPSFIDVRKQMERFFSDFNYPITDVVFSGGEPMYYIHLLEDLVNIVPKQYNIYINTTLLNRNFDYFVNMVNSIDNIKAINVSRHGENYLEDQEMFFDIIDDKNFSFFKKPVRINCVLQNQHIENIINRWHNKSVELSFRQDYRIFLTRRELHNPFDLVSLKINSLGYKFLKHTFCDVCDTLYFEKDGFIISYHRGKINSSLNIGNTLIINDLIIKQNGFFTYDWNCFDKENIHKMQEHFKKKSNRSVLLHNYGGCGGRSSC